MKADAEQIIWVTKWLQSVSSGKATMSQRKVTLIEKRGGGLSLVKRLAKKHQVHLLRLMTRATTWSLLVKVHSKFFAEVRLGHDLDAPFHQTVPTNAMVNSNAA